MSALRCCLRRLVFIWLVFQVATLTAFLPADCCASHRTDVAGTPECHGTATGLCPMRAVTGEECPMHASPASSAAAGPLAPDCVMRAVCDGPASALSMLIPIAGVLSDLPLVTDAGESPIVRPPVVDASSVSGSHNTPPPRL